MHARLRTLTVAIALASPFASPVASPLAAQTAPSKSLDELKLAGRKYAEWVVTALADSLVAHAASPDMVSEIRDNVATMAAQIGVRAGVELSLIEERMVKRNKADQYWRIAKYSTLGEPLLIRVVVSPDGKYAGLGVGPLSQAPPVDPPSP